MPIKKLTDMPIEELRGKRVLLRLDLNVPINGGEIADDFRITKALPTLLYLLRNKAKVIIASHLEDVYSKKGGASSLRPVYEYLKSKINISFAENIKEAATMVSGLEEGSAILLENLRFDEREKENDEGFARELAALGDIYVNECFSVSHRNHASVVGVPRFLDSYAGELFISEVENLSRALNPEHPFVFILGGAKFETKMPLIEKFLKVADYVVVAGALANDFFKAKGLEIGRSTVFGKVDISNMVNDPKLILPSDVVVWTAEGSRVKNPEDVLPVEAIEDIGPQALEDIAPILSGAEFILWNGPLGNYEKGFRDSTLKLAEMISDSKAFSVVGGGDTTAVISSMNVENKFGFVSTGGGAMLEFLEKGTLPGIEALKNSKT